MRYLTLAEVLDLHRLVIEQAGGASEIRDLGGLQSAVAQPMVTFGRKDLYGTIEEKAAALGYSVIQNHPFVDGNKRVGHAAMEIFLLLNGWELDAAVEEGERVILDVATSRSKREQLVQWIRDHLTEARRPET